MPRARSLKPGFFKNETLAQLGMPAMILFEGLWTLADREGRLEDRPLRIRAEIFPYFPEQPVDKLLTSLASAGFIKRYTFDGNGYISIPTWKKHQNPHIKEAASTIPAPDQHGASTVLAPDEHQIDTSVALLTPDSGLLTPDTLTPDSGLLTPDSPVTAADAAGEFVSSKFVLLPPETDKPSVSVTPRSRLPVYPTAFQNYLTVFYAGGKHLNHKDEEGAFKAWKKLALSDQIAAGENAVEIVQNRDPKYIPFPVNHLRGKEWTRTGPGRMIPLPPKSAREASQREAERLFDERRKTK